MTSDPHLIVGQAGQSCFKHAGYNKFGRSIANRREPQINLRAANRNQCCMLNLHIVQSTVEFQIRRQHVKCGFDRLAGSVAMGRDGLITSSAPAH